MYHENVPSSSHLYGDLTSPNLFTALISSHFSLRGPRTSVTALWGIWDLAFKCPAYGWICASGLYASTRSHAIVAPFISLQYIQHQTLVSHLVIVLPKLLYQLSSCLPVHDYLFPSLPRTTLAASRTARWWTKTWNGDSLEWFRKKWGCFPARWVYHVVAQTHLVFMGKGITQVWEFARGMRAPWGTLAIQNNASVAMSSKAIN